MDKQEIDRVEKDFYLSIWEVTRDRIVSTLVIVGLFGLGAWTAFFVLKRRAEELSWKLPSREKKVMHE